MQTLGQNIYPSIQRKQPANVNAVVGIHKSRRRVQRHVLAWNGLDWIETIDGEFDIVFVLVMDAIVAAAAAATANTCTHVWMHTHAHTFALSFTLRNLNLKIVRICWQWSVVNLHDMMCRRCCCCCYSSNVFSFSVRSFVSKQCLCRRVKCFRNLIECHS